jgi:hypothetical protein
MSPIVPPCAMCHPCSGDTCHLDSIDFLPGLTKLRILIMFSYELCLTFCLCHWKSEDELYTIMPFLQSFEVVEF